MDVIVIVYVFFVGLAFGSFALAMVDRMKSGKDWVKGRSECDDCSHSLGPRDLIPLVSWALSKGRCRYCSVKLSWFYPLVELAGGSVFALSYFSAAPFREVTEIAVFVLWLAGVVIMLALAVFDFRWYLLPNKLIYPLVAVSFTHWIAVYLITDNSGSGYILSGAASVIVGWGLFFVLHRMSKGKWIGDGDYRLGVAIGFFLGGPVLAWLALFVASVFGIVAAVPVYVKTKKLKKIKIPFGPFLMLGLLVSYLWGQNFIDWYSGAFLYL